MFISLLKYCWSLFCLFVLYFLLNAFSSDFSVLMKVYMYMSFPLSFHVPQH